MAAWAANAPTAELKALSRIKEVRHPFLLSLERIEVIDGQLIIVTELADASLMNRFEECVASGRPGIPRDELLIYMSDAADALDFMRENFSLQHLDIKPENLLILSGRVKVGDFGLVKDIQDVAVSMVGGLTPVYAAPEVFGGHPSLHSDQYSLAIVYQELLTGVLPFSGHDHGQLATQHQCGSPRLAPLPAGRQADHRPGPGQGPGTIAFHRAAIWSIELRNGPESCRPAGPACLPPQASQVARGDTSSAKAGDTESRKERKHGKQSGRSLQFPKRQRPG